jgi:uncharacterized membrane protein YphA (DoxX/SURF4 family)
MQIVKYVIMAILFAILSPGVLIWLPTGASRRVAALVHGIVFAVVWYFVHEFVESIEGFDDKKKK